MPARLSSPTAVQASVALESVTAETATLAVAGRRVSGAEAVALEITFETSDQLPASSAVLMANQ